MSSVGLGLSKRYLETKYLDKVFTASILSSLVPERNTIPYLVFNRPPCEQSFPQTLRSKAHVEILIEVRTGSGRQAVALKELMTSSNVRVIDFGREWYLAKDRATTMQSCRM